MGYALAAEAVARGAHVILISGPTHLPVPAGVQLVRVTTAEEMLRATLNQAQGADLILKAAAVADYRPEERSRAKIKKESLHRKALREGSGNRAISVRMVPTHDILEELGRRKKPGQVLVGFAAETGRLGDNARRKLQRKNLDMVIANRIGAPGEGFESETNRALMLDRDGAEMETPMMSKDDLARLVLDRAERFLPERPRRPTLAVVEP